LVNKYPSPDSSENPFYFFFKNKKIATNSWIKLLKKEKIAPKNLSIRHKKTVLIVIGTVFIF